MVKGKSKPSRVTIANHRDIDRIWDRHEKLAVRDNCERFLTLFRSYADQRVEFNSIASHLFRKMTSVGLHEARTAGAQSCDGPAESAKLASPLSMRPEHCYFERMTRALPLRARTFTETSLPYR